MQLHDIKLSISKMFHDDLMNLHSRIREERSRAKPKAQRNKKTLEEMIQDNPELALKTIRRKLECLNT